MRINRRWTHVSAPQVDAVDTTGAGEVLAGAFLALGILGLAPEAALLYAVRLASAKVADFGFGSQRLHREISDIRSAVAEVSKPAL
jgi:sugar/nucleoside kinase (ribokinase family)